MTTPNRPGDFSEGLAPQRRRYVSAHCEPTGLDPNVDGIFDVALVRFDNGEPASRLSSLLNPQCAIPPPLAAACSISNLDVADQPTLDDLMPELRAFCAGDVVVAHDTEIARLFLREICEDGRWLSLAELAAHAWPLALIDDYSSRGLLEYTDLADHVSLRGLPLERAKGEAVTVGVLMHDALENLAQYGYATLADLREIAARRTPVNQFWFGQSYRSKMLHDIPEYYLRWVLDDAARPPRLRTLHVDPNTLYAIRVHLAAYRPIFLACGRRGGGPMSHATDNGPIGMLIGSNLHSAIGAK